MGGVHCKCKRVPVSIKFGLRKREHAGRGIPVTMLDDIVYEGWGAHTSIAKSISRLYVAPDDWLERR